MGHFDSETVTSTALGGDLSKKLEKGQAASTDLNKMLEEEQAAKVKGIVHEGQKAREEAQEHESSTSRRPIETPSLSGAPSSLVLSTQYHAPSISSASISLPLSQPSEAPSAQPSLHCHRVASHQLSLALDRAPVHQYSQEA